MLSQSQLRSVWSPRCSGPWGTVSLHGKGKVTVRAAAVEATKALNNCLVAWNYQTRYADTGAYVCRTTATGAISLHAYGIAIDINWLLNPYGGSRHHIPTALATAICRIRTNNGAQVWNWGGFWDGTRDWMHFEIVCSPRDLASGINWSTVPGATPKPIDYAALRKWTAGILYTEILPLPVMWLNNIQNPEHVKTLRKALNLVLNENLPVDGVYDADQDWQVQRFQHNVESLLGGNPIPENRGTFADATKVYLAKALANIRDGK